MVVLVTNDDGIDAEGINLLFEALSSNTPKLVLMQIVESYTLD